MTAVITFSIPLIYSFETVDNNMVVVVAVVGVIVGVCLLFSCLLHVKVLSEIYGSKQLPPGPVSY